jgi:hypothetical protein
MLMRRLLASLGLVTLCSVSAAAALAGAVRAEIDTLLNRLQASGCQFNRNGTLYTGSEAKDHLSRKLEYIEGKASVGSTEQFIDLAASRSSSSGRAYLVKCGSEAPVESKLWLGNQLSSIRGSNGKIKP